MQMRKNIANSKVKERKPIIHLWAPSWWWRMRIAKRVPFLTIFLFFAQFFFTLIFFFSHTRLQDIMTMPVFLFFVTVQGFPQSFSQSWWPCVGGDCRAELSFYTIWDSDDGRSETGTAAGGRSADRRFPELRAGSGFRETRLAALSGRRWTRWCRSRGN